VASEGCRGRGETGAGAAAAVTTGKEGSGEGWCHTKRWVVRKTSQERRHGKKMQKKRKCKGEGQVKRTWGLCLAKGR